MQGDSAVQPQPTGGQPAPGQQNKPQWQYSPGDDEDYSEQPAGNPPARRGFNQAQVGNIEMSWNASEFIDHSKGPGWYAALAGGTALVVIFLFIVSEDFVSMAAVIIMATLFGIIARRKPRVLEYHLDRAGLTVGPAFYPYADFRSFSVVDEGAFSSIMFSPLKRFMPPVNIYYDPKDEEQIVNVLSQYLPFEERTHDAIDRFTRRIRF